MPADPVPPATSLRSARLWLMLALTTGIQALVTFAALTFAAIGPEVAGGLGVSPDLVGYQVSLLYVGATTTSLVAGWQLRRWGPIRTSQGSLALAAAGAALLAVPTLPAIALGSLVLGLGYGMTNPASSEILNKLAPPGKRNLVFSIKQTGVPLGGVLAGLLAPRISETLGWQWAPALAAAACVVLLFVAQLQREAWDWGREPGARLRENPFAGMSTMWAIRPLRWMAVDGFFYAAVQLCLGTFTVTLLVAEAGFDLIAAGAVLAGVQGAGIAGRLVWGWVADRTGKGFSILVANGTACLVAALLVVNLDAGWPPAAVAALFAAFGFNALGWTGVFQAQTVRYAPPGTTGAVVGAVTAPSYAGVIVGPAAFALVFALTGAYTTTFALVAGFAAAGAACLLVAVRAAHTVTR